MRIVTHAGTAHADELLAISLVLLKEGLQPGGVDVVRKGDGSAKDWPDADFVIDIGRHYNPKKRWFDHHQFPAEAGPSCAFTLVARYYKVDLNGLRWADRLSIVDSKGPVAWFEHVLGRPPKSSMEMNDVMCDSSTLFRYVADVAADDYDRALSLGRDWLEFQLRSADKHVRDAKKAHDAATVFPLRNGLKMVWFPDCIGNTAMIGVANKMHDDDPSIVVSACDDDRSGGYAAYRICDDDRVDFSGMAGRDGCVFAHNTGFCMVFRRDWDGFVGAVCEGLRP